MKIQNEHLTCHFSGTLTRPLNSALGVTMNKSLLVFVLIIASILSFSFSLAMDDCQQELLPDATLKLLKPFLEDVIANWDKGYNNVESVTRSFALIDNILNDKTVAGDKAVAFILFIYTGEGYGEIFICEAIIRGKRMLPIIRQYKNCLPKTGLEPFPCFLEGSGVLVRDAIQEIEKGNTCTHVER